MAFLSSACFGAALAFLFPRLSGYGQLLIALFYLAFISSGAFITSMVPAITLTWVTTLGLAAYAAAASYESVSGLAAAHHVPLSRLNPLGIDGGLFSRAPWPYSV